MNEISKFGCEIEVEKVFDPGTVIYFPELYLDLNFRPLIESKFETKLIKPNRFLKCWLLYTIQLTKGKVDLDYITLSRMTLLRQLPFCSVENLVHNGDCPFEITEYPGVEQFHS